MGFVYQSRENQILCSDRLETGVKLLEIQLCLLGAKFAEI